MFSPDPALLVSALVYKLKSFLALLLLMEPSNQFLPWLLAVGAVSAEQMPERQWFEGHLALVSSYLSMTTWEDLKRHLTEVMSHAVFCEDTFYYMWDETAAL